MCLSREIYDFSYGVFFDILFLIISAGNVATSEMVESLIMEADVDIIKVGIGPGSVCTTRKITGVGIPQLSCIMECSDAAHGIGGMVMSDGGCTCSGDISKAFGANADFVMLGGLLAGHNENSKNNENSENNSIIYDEDPLQEVINQTHKKND